MPHAPRLLALAALVLLACAKPPKSVGPELGAPGPAAPARAAEAERGPLGRLPGMDFSALPASAQRELATVLSDEFCYCGCPHTVAACLEEHSTCKHARRMAQLAASQVAAGAPASEVLVSLSRYYAGFRERRAVLAVDPRMCMGRADAPVTLVEFSDFECPYCAAARPVLEAFAKQRADQVRFCYLPFPLSMHPNAVPAAQAALLARDSGKFWAMHDALFINNRALDRGGLLKLAGGVGLPAGALEKALAAGTYEEELEKLKAAGEAAGVQGTPALFVNGRSFDLGFTQEALAHTLEDELEWNSHTQAWAAD